jgi:hypothetical protein
MERMRLRRVWPCLALVAGCGGGASDGVDVNNGLYINAGLGATLIDAPITVGATPEGGMDAFVVVSRDDAQGAPVAATLTVNGVEVPQDIAFGAFLGYDFSQVAIPVAPGGELHLHAAFEGASADLTLRCPDEVAFSAPADGTSVDPADEIAVRWDGTVDYATSIRPDLMVRGFDPASGERTELGFGDRVESGRDSDAFPLPALQGAPEWLVDLYVPGDLVNDAAGVGFCMLDRRLHLVAR